MAYAPTTVTASTPVPSQTLRDNDDALRVYLHEGIIAGDLKASDWIDTRHIQPPTQLVKRGLQTGVTGVAGGQSVRPRERFTFTSYATTGVNRRNNQDLWDVVPDTALTIPLAASAKVIYHWHVAAVVGPDKTNPSGAPTPVVQNADRRVYLAPYMMKFDEELTVPRWTKRRWLRSDTTRLVSSQPAHYPTGAVPTNPTTGSGTASDLA